VVIAEPVTLIRSHGKQVQQAMGAPSSLAKGFAIIQIPLFVASTPAVQGNWQPKPGIFQAYFPIKKGLSQPAGAESVRFTNFSP